MCDDPYRSTQVKKLKGSPDRFRNGNLVSPGFYQFNVTIPDLPDGDHAIVAETGGSSSLATVFISVRR